LKRQAGAWRADFILARAPFAANRLARLHSILVAEIESLRSEYRQSSSGSAGSSSFSTAS
jgi:hypothetical protein